MARLDMNKAENTILLGRITLLSMLVLSGRGTMKSKWKSNR